jgi:proteic killer suppression protein
LRRVAIRSFANPATEDINYARRSKRALRLLPATLHDKARVKLARLHAAESLNDLATLSGNRLEKLRGDRAGQHSIRLNDQYRICFVWKDLAAERVEIVDYH